MDLGPVRSRDVMTPVVLPAPPSTVVYLLWSHKHDMWWSPAAAGYTTDMTRAGRYSEREAVRYVVNSAQCGLLAQVTSMVAAPDNWMEHS